MDASPAAPSATTAPEISLIRGGPFYRVQHAIGLIGEEHWNLGRRFTVLVAITWLPLLVITLLTNFKGLHSFLLDYRAHARLLIAVPALLFGEIYMESRLRGVLIHLRKSGLLDAPDMAYMDRVVAAVLRARDAYIPELAVLVLLILHTIFSYKGLIDGTPWLAYGSGDDIRLTPAGWYMVVVSAPLFQFLLGLGLWKWLLWTYFAFRLSQRKLQVLATHPDEHGGLGFLGLTASAFAPVAFAASSVIAATWRYDIVHHGAKMIEFRLPAIALLAIIAVIALGPLVFFVPRLMALRRQGILEYGILAQIHSADFHEKWISHRAGHEAEFLQAPESSTLNSFGNVYEKIKALKPFPADAGSLYVLAAAVAIPALPVLLTQIPVSVVLTDLLKALR
jgi:hypothetical protein